MKKKIMLSMVLFILIFVILLSSTVVGYNGMGYVIDEYDINMIVNEDNTLI